MVEYQLPKTTLTLNFKDTIFDGAEVKLKTEVSMQFLLNMQKATTSDDTEEVIAAFWEFGDKVLIEWNIHDADGIPIPATGQGILEVEALGFVQKLVSEWAEAVVQPPAPLPPRSSDGTTGEQIPTTSETAEMIGSPAELNLSDFSKQN